MMNTSNFMLSGEERYVLWHINSFIYVRNLVLEVAGRAGRGPEKWQDYISITSPPGRWNVGVNNEMDLSSIFNAVLMVPESREGTMM